VPNLTRGAPPPINLGLLQEELTRLLAAIEAGSLSFASDETPQKQYSLADIRDVAFSGNGEPTSAAEFPHAVSLVQHILESHGLARQVKIRLITNGSLLDRPEVQTGIAKIGQTGGEVWFKIDSASAAGMSSINSIDLKPEAVARRLARCASLAPTWVQTCLFALDSTPPSEAGINQYMALIAPWATELKGVHLYGLARTSLQAEAHRLTRLDPQVLEQIAKKVRKLGLPVHVSP
jgi:wyosine [tRNA(Phe)-imidazoG37] synthetase (radical SAM superfamily)